MTTLQEAVNKIDTWQVGAAFVTGLLPGGRVVQSLAGAGTDVFLTWRDAQSDACSEYPFEEMVQDFAKSFAIEMIGSYIGDFASKYGVQAIEQGLKQLGVDEATIKKLTKALDDGDGSDGSDSSSSTGPNVCSFSPDTPVLTRDGLKPISTLFPWEQVWAYNEATGEFGWYPITAVWVEPHETLLYLTLDSEVIETTPEHPFLLADGRWVAAGDL